MKVFFATLVHESNNLSPIPTTLKNFRDVCCYIPSTGEGREQRDRYHERTQIPQRLEARGIEVAESVTCLAWPSLPLVRKDYDWLKAQILADLKNAMPVNGVVLLLHGAQMAQGIDDVEADIISMVRGVVGEKTPIICGLDLHTNLTPEMVEAADALIACKEYPHTDWPERGGEMIDLCIRAMNGDVKPVMARREVPLLGVFPTTRQPMRALVDDLPNIEARPGVLSVSLTHGFPLADHKDAHAQTLVVCDGDQDQAQKIADELADRFFAIREEANTPYLSFDEALDIALQDQSGKPVVIGDGTDNQGGAAPGDSTSFLRRLLERGVTNAALAMIWDPVAVEFCEAAGVGAEIPLRIGGKVGLLSDAPLDVKAKIIALSNTGEQKGLGSKFKLGAAAGIEIDGVKVVLNSIRQQTFSPDCFSELGIDPTQQSILIVKSSQHFHFQFAPIASEVLYARKMKSMRDIIAALPLTQLKRPAWPLDEPPFHAFGRDWRR